MKGSHRSSSTRCSSPDFKADHLHNLVAETETLPTVNQIEIHPLFNQAEMRAANEKLGIQTQARSPIGGTYINHPREPGAVTLVLEHPVFKGLAERIGRIPAQRVLRWHLQNGVAVIPKSAHPDRIASNIDVFDFVLPTEDKARQQAQARKWPVVTRSPTLKL